MESPQPNSKGISSKVPPPVRLLQPNATVANPTTEGRKESPSSKVTSNDEAAKKKIKTAQHVVDVIPAGVRKAEEEAKMRASETDNTASETENSGSETESSGIVPKDDSFSSGEYGKDDEAMVAPPPPALRSSAAIVLPMPTGTIPTDQQAASSEQVTKENTSDRSRSLQDNDSLLVEDEVPTPTTLEGVPTPDNALTPVVPVPIERDAAQESLAQAPPESIESALAPPSLEASLERMPASDAPQEAFAPSIQETTPQAEDSGSEQDFPNTNKEETELTPMEEALRILTEQDGLSSVAAAPRPPTERPEAKRVATCTAIDVDAVMEEYYANNPPPTDFCRSESQQAAVNAVLEQDTKEDAESLHQTAAKIMSEDDEKKLKSTNSAATIELTDEELPAAIAPVLRRQSSSTPGAFHAGGRSSGVISPPESLRVASSGHSRASQGSGSSRLTQSSHESVGGTISVEDSCTTLVSATLVPSHDSDTAGTSFRDSGNHLLAIASSHVEPVWWKRGGSAYCGFAFVFMAVAVIALGVSMAMIVNNKSESMSTPLTPPANTEVPAVAPPTSPPVVTTPVPAPVAVTNIGSHHTVMWGKVSTCEDSAFFSDYNLDIRCGGKLVVVYQENADCSQVEDSKASCELLVTSEPTLTDDGFYYQEALGYVIFSCEGETRTDLTGTALLPDMPLNNCTNVVLEDGANRRDLLQAQPRAAVYQSSDFGAAHARAVQEAISKGGGSAFMSIGRFCRETGSDEWDFWHELYVCEKGKRLITTALGALYDGVPPDVSKIFGDAEEDDGGGRRHRRRLAQERNGGVRRRRLQIDFFDLLWQYADLNSYCYNFDTCTGDELGCNTQIGAVGISDSDPRDSCHRDLDDQPSLAYMVEIMKDSFDPAKFLDRLSSGLEA